MKRIRIRACNDCKPGYPNWEELIMDIPVEDVNSIKRFLTMVMYGRPVIIEEGPLDPYEDQCTSEDWGFVSYDYGVEGTSSAGSRLFFSSEEAFRNWFVNRE